jgi:hypothetical protein
MVSARGHSSRAAKKVLDRRASRRPSASRVPLIATPYDTASLGMTCRDNSHRRNCTIEKFYKARDAVWDVSIDRYSSWSCAPHRVDPVTSVAQEEWGSPSPFLYVPLATFL